MSDAWVTIGVLTVVTAAMRAAGPALMGERVLAPRAERVISLLAPALLSALIVTETFGAPGPSITLDARAGGLAAAAIVLLYGRSMSVAVVVAAATTALLRLVT